MFTAEDVTLYVPVLNGAGWIEQLMLSLRAQDTKPRVVVLDAQSSDGTLDICARFPDVITEVDSRPDDGQSARLAEAFGGTKTPVAGWINADDTLLPGAVSTVLAALSASPENALAYGDYELVYPSGRVEQRPKIDFDFAIALYAYCMVPQPGSLFRMEHYNRCGGIDPSLQFSFDYDLALRLARVGQVVHVRYPVSRFAVHPESKSTSSVASFQEEDRRIRQAHGAADGLRGKILSRWHLARAVRHFAAQRGYVPLRSTAGKA
jgi:glycosyltransferase involved in cell wall biosynthesis